MSFKYGVHTGIEPWETETTLEKWNTIHLILIKKQIHLKLHYSLESSNKLLQIMIWKFQLALNCSIYMNIHVTVSLNLTKFQNCPIVFSNVYSQENIIKIWIFRHNLDTAEIIKHVHYKS